MLVQFAIGNYRSFHETQELNFRPTKLVSDNKSVDERNIWGHGESAVLKIVGVYGPNGSGKSNLLKGITYFKRMVDASLSSEVLHEEHNPFRLIKDDLDQYGHFEITLQLRRRKYRYGFTLDKDGNIDTEWLFGPAEKNETYYFTRKLSKIDVNSERFKEGVQLPYQSLRKDTLFLTFCSSYAGEVSSSIRDYITEKIIIEGYATLNPLIAMYGRGRQLTDSLVEKGNKKTVLRWLREAGMPFSDINLKDFMFDNRKIGNYVLLTKDAYNSSGEISGKISMNLETTESEGTKKFYSYIGGLHKVFSEGGVFVSDEIDNNFHPSLLRTIIQFFQDEEVNVSGAQLLFTSHDVNLMNPDLMRRDQFYFTQKTRSEETRLFSLAEIKGVRNNADFAKHYLAGYYGALPNIRNSHTASKD